MASASATRSTRARQDPRDLQVNPVPMGRMEQLDLQVNEVVQESTTHPPPHSLLDADNAQVEHPVLKETPERQETLVLPDPMERKEEQAAPDPQEPAAPQDLAATVVGTGTPGPMGNQAETGRLGRRDWQEPEEMRDAQETRELLVVLATPDGLETPADKAPKHLLDQRDPLDPPDNLEDKDNRETPATTPDTAPAHAEPDSSKKAQILHFALFTFFFLNAGVCKN